MTHKVQNHENAEKGVFLQLKIGNNYRRLIIIFF
jgi:hypothetical protein